MGGRAAEIAEAAAENGDEIPASVLAANDLWPCSELYRDAYHTLSRSRGHGMAGPLPIAVSEIVAYGNAIGLVGEELLVLIRMCQAQDTVFLERASE